MRKGFKHSDATKKKMSETRKGKPSNRKGSKHSNATKKKMSESQKGVPSPNKDKPMSDAQKKKISKAMKGKPAHNKGKPSPLKGRKVSEATKKRQSASMQNIPYEDWEKFACEKKYCPKFDEKCRESCRAKYNYECFVCGLPQSENKTKNGKVRKLSVHHVDMDKAQGCESNWKLVPLCLHHHATAHNDELVARLGYLIKEK